MISRANYNDDNRDTPTSHDHIKCFSSTKLQVVCKLLYGAAIPVLKFYDYTVYTTFFCFTDFYVCLQSIKGKYQDQHSQNNLVCKIVSIFLLDSERDLCFVYASTIFFYASLKLKTLIFFDKVCTFLIHNNHFSRGTTKCNER